MAITKSFLSAKKFAFAAKAAVETFVVGVEAKAVTLGGKLNGDTIAIEGFANDYKVVATNGRITLTSFEADGKTVAQAITFSLARGNSASVQFLDGALAATYSTDGKVAKLGDQVLTRTSTAVTAAGINEAITSEAKIDEAVTGLVSTPASGGQTFTLTAGVDVPVLTAQADTVKGYVNTTTGAVDSTLTAADDIDGGAGVDVMTLTVAGGNAGSMPGTNIRNVENFYIRDVNTGGASTYNFAAVTGEQQVWSDRSTQDVEFSSLEKGTTVGLNGDNATVLGAVTFSMATLTDDVSIAIANGVGKAGTAPAITNSALGATKATISSTGAANKVGSITLANTTTITSLTINAAANLEGTLANKFGTDAAITISGAAKEVKLGTLAGTIKTVDASGLTAGGLNATLSASTTDVKGGASADTVTLNTGVTTANFGAGDDLVTTADLASDSTTIDGGAGTDTLVVAAAGDVDTGTEAADFLNFETLRVGNDAVDMALFTGSTIIKIEKSAGGAATTNMTATQAANVTLLGNDAGSTFALATATGTADVLSVTSANTTAATSADMTTATITGFETLNFTSNSGVANTTTTSDRTAVSFTAAGDLKTINLSGSKSVNLNASASAVKVTKIDASAIAGGAIIATGGQTGALVVTGSAVADSITANAVGTGGTVNINAGAGDDTITLAAGVLTTTATVTGGAGNDTVNATFSASQNAGIVNVNAETLSLTLDGSNVIDTRSVVADTIRIAAVAAAGDDLVINNYLSGDVVSVAATFDALTVNSSTATTASVKFGAAATLADLILDPGMTTLAVDADNAGTITTVTGAALTTINVTGDSALTITNALPATVTTINASASTGALTASLGAAGTATGGSAADSITGSSGKDTINGGAGDDTLSGGDGADTITFGAGVDVYKHDAANDSATGTVVSGTTDISSSVDLVYGAGDGDKFNFALTTALGAAISDEALAGSLITLANGTSNIDIIRGTYNTSTGIFTIGSASADDDYMIQAQDAENASADTLHSVVLIGVAGTVTFDATTAGLVTLQVA